MHKDTFVSILLKLAYVKKVLIILRIFSNNLLGFGHITKKCISETETSLVIYQKVILIPI